MIKDIHSQWLGNIADGDVKEWPNTILKVMQKFPEARVVIPGHGATGGMELVEHTYNLLKAKE